MYTPHCVVCAGRGKFKPITWAFYLCKECDEEFKERPEWVKFLVNDEAKKRRRLTDADRTRDGKELYIEETNITYTMITPEDWMVMKEDYACLLILDTDMVELKDSDWESVYSYGV